MNRKLQRSTLALSATTAVLAILLMAGGPALPPPLSSTDSLAIATTVNGDDAAAGDRDGDIRVLRKHQRRSRAALALPYFSFAQGLRRVTGS